MRKSTAEIAAQLYEAGWTLDAARSLAEWYLDYAVSLYLFV
jgi:hypothetical protein